MSTEPFVQPQAIVAFVALGVIGTGIVGGLTHRIVVFRDAHDLVLSFAALAVPLGLYYFGALFLSDSAPILLRLWTAVPVAAVLVLLFILLRRTAQDNAGWLSTGLALLTKIPLGLLFLVVAVNAVAPTGKSAAARATNRQQSIFALLILTPLMLALTRDRESLTSFRLGR